MKYTPLLLIPLLLVGFGCQKQEPPKVPNEHVLDEITAPNFIPGGKWQEVNEFVDRLEYYFATNKSSKLVIYRMHPDAFEFELANTDEPKYVSVWKEEFPDSSFVLNGAYFHEDMLPSGLFISDGERVGAREFDLDKTGLISFAPKFAIIDTAEDDVDLDALTHAAQSYPFLYKRGEPAIEDDSEKLARRTFIGTDKQGAIYIGILPNETKSLFELMNILDNVRVDWNFVLNLDGGPSSGLVASVDETNEIFESYSPVPNVIIVTARELDSGAETE